MPNFSFISIYCHLYMVKNWQNTIILIKFWWSKIGAPAPTLHTYWDQMWYVRDQWCTLSFQISPWLVYNVSSVGKKSPLYHIFNYILNSDSFCTNPVTNQGQIWQMRIPSLYLHAKLHLGRFILSLSSGVVENLELGNAQKSSSLPLVSLTLHFLLHLPCPSSPPFPASCPDIKVNDLTNCSTHMRGGG